MNGNFIPLRPPYDEGELSNFETENHTKIPKPYRDFLKRYGPGSFFDHIKFLPIEEISDSFRNCFDTPHLLFTTFWPVGFDERLQETLCFVLHKNSQTFVHISHEYTLESCPTKGTAKAVEFADYLSAIVETKGQIPIALGKTFTVTEKVENGAKQRIEKVPSCEIINTFEQLQLFTSVGTQPPLSCIHFSDLRELLDISFRKLPGAQDEDPFDEYQEIPLIGSNDSVELKDLRRKVQKIMFGKSFDDSVFNIKNRCSSYTVKHKFLRISKDAATEKFLGINGPWTMAYQFIEAGNMPFGIKDGQFVVF